METTYIEASQTICNIIDQCPEDGCWHEIDGYSICIADSAGKLVAAIYEPGSSCSGECDLYVTI